MLPDTRIKLLVLLLLPGVSVPVFAATAREELSELADGIVAGVKTDPEKAEKLIEAAESIEDDRDARVFFFEKAFAFGRKSAAGHPFASRALDQLEKLAPERSQAWSMMRISLLRLKYSASGDADERSALANRILDTMVARGRMLVSGGDIEEAVDAYEEALRFSMSVQSARSAALRKRLFATRRDLKLEKQFRQLLTAVEKDPADTAAREELILLYVLLKDDPSLAEVLLNDDIAASIRTHVPLAARSVDELAPDKALALARWYRQLGADASGISKRTALSRAASYYERYLGETGPDDVRRKEAVSSRREVLKDLKDGGFERRRYAKVPAGAAGGDAATGGLLPAKTGRILSPWGTVVREGPGVVTRASKRGLTWLLSQQADDGGFGGGLGSSYEEYSLKIDKSGYKWKGTAIRRNLAGILTLKPEPRPGSVGMTSLAVLAMLAGGMTLDDDCVAKALGFLKTYDTYLVYSLGLRCKVWSVAESRAPGEYMKYFKHDARRLIYSVHRLKGGWDYSIWNDTFHNSTSQYGVLGVAAFGKGGGAVPKSFWTLVSRYWLKAQLKDGGWSYWPPFRKSEEAGEEAYHAPRGSMSAAGLASVLECLGFEDRQRYLACGVYEPPPVLAKGLQWFDDNFAGTLSGTVQAGPDRRFCYYLYGVKRAGLAAGRRYFGERDWYRAGAEVLFRKQADSGSWQEGSLSETAFALLFLLDGGSPLVFNHLKRLGDWNNRPRALSNLLRWAGSRAKRRFSRRIAEIKADDRWHDAPVLVITGSRKPIILGKQTARLRNFALEGGIIFSIAEGKDDGFEEGMRKIYAEAFPGRELKKVPTSHRVYLKPRPVDDKPALHMIHAGPRPLVIHCSTDLTKVWEQGFSRSNDSAFNVGFNLIDYVSAGFERLRPRFDSYWPRPAVREPRLTREVVVVEYGDEETVARAVEALGRRLTADEGIALTAKKVPLEKLRHCKTRPAVMAGTGEVLLSPSRGESLKEYIESGGMLVVNGAGDRDFYLSMRKHLARMFGADASRPLPADAPIYTRAAAPLNTIGLRATALERLGSLIPRPEVYAVAGRPAVLLSREDITTGLLGCECRSIDGYTPETAYALMRNIVMVTSGADEEIAAMDRAEREQYSPPDVHLSALSPISATSGRGTEPQADTSVTGDPLRLAGRTYKKGIGVHAVSTLGYPLDPRYERFVATVGLDDGIRNAHLSAKDIRGSAVFKVYVDSILLAESPVMKYSMVHHFNVAIPPESERIALMVSNAGDTVIDDRADWVNAGFTVSKSSSSPEEKEPGESPGNTTPDAPVKDESENSAGEKKPAAKEPAPTADSGGEKSVSGDGTVKETPGAGKKETGEKKDDSGLPAWLTE